MEYILTNNNVFAMFLIKNLEIYEKEIYFGYLWH